MDFSSFDRLYLRPTAFVDTPISMDGNAVRLAGGLLWFSGYEVIAVHQGKRVLQRTYPVTELPADDRLQLLATRIAAPRPALNLGERTLRFDQPQVMAILNITPDSFSDGGRHAGDPAAAAETGVEMAAQGAALIDIGGESTRPGAATVWEGDEIARVVPVIERLARSGTLVSVDTRKAAVMEAALAAGAHIVNDVSALLWDDRALQVVADAGCPVVLMHAGDPKQGADGGRGHADPLIEVYDWLEARIDAVVAAGVDRGRIIADPGIGFGKSLSDNLALLNGLALFHGLGVPLLLGASRKRMIGALSNEAPADRRLGGSVALALKGADLGAQLLRVHDVPETVQALHVWRGMRDAALVGR
ncbi:MAG: dihydropteroate synthase [Alphaproteobacteria bacterium HGW-Alphaproteobacteria-16]|nr:MAG: dihydropteroate synthase [Alphaproteobacteria bacterium HGW-Alphaproteobacteria-16]